MPKRAPTASVTALILAACTGATWGETVAVDATADRHPISPLVYGVAFASQAALADLNCPLNRHGGNTTTRYNWQANASNHANDWFFESIADGPATPGAAVDDFIAATRAGGAAPMITIPMLGWVAKVSPTRDKLCSFSQAKYGAQTGNDWQWFGDAGNGVLTGGAQVSGNDANDADVPADAAFQAPWLAHLVTRWGASGAGGVRWYLLDNEHSLWHSTHRDVHPAGAGMDEIRQKMVDYATMIKTADAGALVVGPEEWGWTGYLYSGADAQRGAQHGWSALPDRAAHGGMDYIPWLLAQMSAASAIAGQRLLDVCSVHWYPQGGEFSDDVSSAMQLRRNRSTRSLWDPAYTDETWVAAQVELIPRLKRWVAAGYPGTQVALTEYNWGAESHINGATTQADILGILGREGCDLATRWTTPAASTPTYLAMRLYRNYDGARSAFGEQNVRAATADPDRLSSFAALRSGDGALTVMLVRKDAASASTTVSLAHFAAASSAGVWQLTSANRIVRLADTAVAGGAVSLVLPGQSVTLVVIPAAGGGSGTGTGSASGSGASSGAGTTGASGASSGAGTAGGSTGSTGSSGGSGHGSCGLGGGLGATLIALLVAGASAARSLNDPRRGRAPPAR